jgi:outer membrane protein assembly factor BamD
MRAKLWAGVAALALLSGCTQQHRIAIKSSPAEQFDYSVQAMQAGDYQAAATSFDIVRDTSAGSSAEAELLAAYADYKQGAFASADDRLTDFIFLHPSHKAIPYAYYLKALTAFDQIRDSQLDQKNTHEAITRLKDVVLRFPNSEYGKDSLKKIYICHDVLANKELQIGRFYERQHVYTAALGRYQRVVYLFAGASSVPEALHRLTETYLLLGLKEQARITTATLGNSFPASAWYKDSKTLLAGAGIAPLDPTQVEQFSNRCKASVEGTGLACVK